MQVLVMCRVSDRLARYADGIDHTTHDVTYVGTAEQVARLPPDLPGSRLVRPGVANSADEILTALSGRSRPDLVVALSEFDLMDAARVRQELGVPGDDPAQVRLVRDKVAMKTAVRQAGLRVPRFLPLPDALARQDGVPWTGATVVKPRAGLASIDVDVFDTPDAALAALRGGAHARAGVDDFEIEEFVAGPIIHVDGVAVADKPVALQVSRYVGTCLGYARGKPLGSVQIDTDPALVEWATACLQAVRIGTNIFHLEAIHGPDGPVFLEVAGRFGGAGVVETFELATGVHLPSTVQKYWTNPEHVDISMREPRPDGRYGWFVWPGHHLDGDSCAIDDPTGTLTHPLVRRHVRRRPTEPLTRDITYQEDRAPLSGTIGPASSEQLERYLHRQFTTARISARAPGRHP